MNDAKHPDSELLGRSIRTLAWLGDVEWERELRLRLARTGDWRTDRLDTAKSRLARAEAQAQFLDSIAAELTPEEQNFVGRGRNASVRSSGRVRGDTRAYRASTGFEVLIAYWSLSGRWQRFESLLGPPLEQAIGEAIARSAAPRRG